jgi:WD40 repeat protein
MAVDIRSQKLAPFPKAKTEGDENAGPPYIIAFRRDGKRIARTLWKGRFYHIDFGDKWIGYTAFENRDAILAFQNTGKRDPLRNILEIADNLYDVATSGIKFSNAGMWKGEKSIFGLFAGPPAMPGMSGNVISAVFSADGTRFATWTWDGSIQINHTDSGKILCALPRDPNYVTKVTFNSNADSIAAGNVAGSVYVCSVPSGTRIAVLRGYTAPITDLAFRPDGKQIASCSYDGTVRLWDLSVGRFVRTFKGVGIAPLVFSANGERMIAGSHVIEMNAKRKPIFPSELKIGVTSATFDSSGRRIISTPGDKTIRFWDGNLLSYVTTLEIPNGMITSALWNPDGRHIAMNVSTYRPSKWPSPFTNPDGRSAVIWDFVSGEAASIFNWQREADLGETTFNPSAGKVAAVFDNEIQLLSLRPGSQPLSLAIPKGRINRVAFSGNGKTIASADTEKTIALWDASSGRLLRTMTGQADRAINWLEFSPDGRRLVSAGSDKMMRIWDVATGNLLAILRGYKDAVSKAVFSPDGRLVLSTSSDNTVRVWESSGGKENFSFSCDNANALFDQEGSRIYAGCSDGTLGVWNMETGILLARSKSYRGYFRSLTFSPDRSRLIAAVGGTIKIWDAASLTLLLTMPDHDGSVESVAFSPDGSMILSVCNDGSARIWKSRRND